MEHWQIALIIRPFVALFVLGFIALPARLVVQAYMPDGRFKSFLLLPLNNRRNR